MTDCTLYGIPNCDTVKKARAWLVAHGHEHTFCDVRKQPLSPALLQEWLQQHPWTTLVNRAGTTWKKLPAEVQAGVTDADSACALLLAHPAAMKRPVLVTHGLVLVGFKPDSYQACMSAQPSDR
jgi:arsenate reductase